MRRWPRRKVDSARRWLARFRLGKFVPHTALEEHPKIGRKVQGHYQIHRDGYQLSR